MRREPRPLLVRERLDRNCHALHRGQRTAQSKPRLGRNLRLVVSDLAARLLSGGARSEGVSRLLRAAVRHGRAEHDRVPAPGRGAVPPLGRAGAGRIRVRAEAPRTPVSGTRRVRITCARARRPARPRSRVDEERPRRRRPRADARLARSVAARRVRPGASVVGRGRGAARRGRRGPRQRPRPSRAVPLPAAARAAVRRRRAARARRPHPPARRSRSTSTSGTRTSRPRRRMRSGCSSCWASGEGHVRSSSARIACRRRRDERTQKREVPRSVFAGRHGTRTVCPSHRPRRRRPREHDALSAS